MTFVGRQIIASILIVEDGMKLYLAERRDAMGEAIGNAFSRATWFARLQGGLEHAGSWPLPSRNLLPSARNPRTLPLSPAIVAPGAHRFRSPARLSQLAP